jgi:hypothetical protein
MCDEEPNKGLFLQRLWFTGVLDGMSFLFTWFNSFHITIVFPTRHDTCTKSVPCISSVCVLGISSKYSVETDTTRRHLRFSDMNWNCSDDMIFICFSFFTCFHVK